MQSPVAEIKTNFWEQSCEYKVGDLGLNSGDKVIVKTEWGTELGKVINLKEVSAEKNQSDQDKMFSIVRKVTTEDLGILSDLKKQVPEALEYCKKIVDRYDLPMKVIDAHFSFDGSRLIFPFIADGRVDFRQLAKDLTHHFQKTVRLQQIGIRDEARISGDFGSCGRQLCCKTHLDKLESITSDKAELQQVSHRGSERLSGQCGRLRCCLAYEDKNYQELAKILPAIGTEIQTPQGKGKVIGWHTLKQSVDVRIDGNERNIVELPIKIK